MSEVQKIAHNTIIQLIGKALTIGLALIIFGFIARYLGQGGFGHYSTIYAYMAIFGILVDLGLQMTTTKMISDPAENENTIINNALAIRFISSFLFLTLAAFIAVLMPYGTIVKLGIIIAVAGFTASALTTVLTSHFQKNLTTHQMVIAELAGKTATLTLVIMAIKLNVGLLGVVSATMLDSVIVCAAAWGFANKTLRLRLAFDPEVWQKIFSATWPIGITIALNLIYFKGDIFIMSLIKTPNDVGLYAAPYRVLEVLINFVYLILGLLLPLLAAAWAVKDLAKLKRVIQGGFDFLISISVPMIVGGYFAGESLMTLVAGKDFIISGQIIKILLIATGLIFMAGLFGYAIVAIGEQKKMIKFYAGNAIFAIVGYIYFINRYSYWGAAWMTVATELIMLLSTIYILKKQISFLPRITIIYKALGASVVMALFLAYIPLANFVLLVLAGATIYVICLYIFGGFDKKIIQEIISVKKHEGISH
ncbi:MAG: flippase [Candidatus Buchananbacteria bacterium]|nr:flippase [Candidatus Buchananbacteria bacterium]